jgi:predicted transposase/invertase (TIGR01784 family)
MLEPCEGKSFKHGSEGGYTVVRPFSYPTRGSDVPDLPDKERWRELKMDNPGIEQAMEALEFLSQNPEARALYEMREKAKRDEVSAIVSAERRGKAEGREKGREEGKILVAKNLLSKGNLSIKEIGEVTGLPISEIEKLKQQFR